MKPLLFLGLALLCVAAPTFAAPIAVVKSAKVELLSPARVAALPDAERELWNSYLNRSQALQNTERAQLLTESGGAKPPKAPVAKDFKMKREWSGDWFKTPEAATLANVMMSYQTPSGGWSKAVDYSRGPRPKGTAWTSQSQTFHYAATFDNRATTEQLNFLNEFFAATGRAEAKRSIGRGLDYIFAAQFPNGGWPQTFPLEGGYHDAITFNDNAMTHVLELLRAISSDDDSWKWLDAGRREQSQLALRKGITCVLAAQVEQGGRKTVWCAQHDPLDLQPVAARLKEPASLSGGESVGIVRFLMPTPNPTPAIRASIESALAWFDLVKIKNADDTWKWARFYEPKNNTPLFAGADDGIIYPTFEAMAAHNHIGYDYFVTTPNDLLEKQAPKWRHKIQTP